MSSGIVITQIEQNKIPVLFCGLFDESRLVEARLFPAPEKQEGSAASSQNPLLGNIYIGKVQRVLKDLDAAFVEITPGVAGYLSLQHAPDPVFVRRGPSLSLTAGDEILVQVSRDASRGKGPTLSVDLSFTGRYAVLTTGSRRFGVSSRLGDAERARLKSLFHDDMPDGCGLIIRTNAKNVPEEEIRSEIDALSDTMRGVISHAPNHTCYSCIYRPPGGFLSYLLNLHTEGIEKIVTDLPEVYASLGAYCAKYNDLSGIPLSLYEDDSFSLGAMYHLSREITRATAREVCLRSGGFLVIDPTEAMTVIDVNSGKNTTKKNRREHFVALNREASREIAAQLRLRNLSGIILVDFIDLETKEEKQDLLSYLKGLVKDDPVPVTVHDITALGLVEITRKKVEKSLSEQIKQLTMKNPV